MAGVKIKMPGGTGGGGTDEKAKVSSNDTTEGYLNGKLVAGTGITLTENNDGGNETLTITSTGGAVTIPELTSDPVSPAAEEAWVLHTVPTGAGTPIGLLLALTRAGAGSETWHFSYKTSTGGIKRIELT